MLAWRISRLVIALFALLEGLGRFQGGVSAGVVWNESDGDAAINLIMERRLSISSRIQALRSSGLNLLKISRGRSVDGSNGADDDAEEQRMLKYWQELVNPLVPVINQHRKCHPSPELKVLLMERSTSEKAWLIFQSTKGLAAVLIPDRCVARTWRLLLWRRCVDGFFIVNVSNSTADSW